MTYRDAEQLRQYAMTLSESRPAEVLARLLSVNAHPHESAGLLTGMHVDYVLGELAALFLPGTTDSFADDDYNIVLSARPDFVFAARGARSPTMMNDPDSRFNFTAALLAKTLEEAGFPVDATGLRWDTYLSLAWTEWSRPRLPFAWTRHNHPRPDQLLAQTLYWRQFIETLGPGQQRKGRDWLAYAWIYHQRRWSKHRADVALDPIRLGKSNPNDDLPWDKILDFGDPNDDAESAREIERWRYRTLPLLARPEIGFPPEVQLRLLGAVGAGDTKIKKELYRQRRHLVTDAFVASDAQQGRVTAEIPDDAEVQGAIDTIDQEYRRVHNGLPWEEMVESGLNDEQ